LKRGEYLSKCTKLIEQLGREHPATLPSAGNVKRQKRCIDGHWTQEIRDLDCYALNARLKVLRQEHPFMLSSISNFSNVLSSRGKYGEAEEMYRRALDTREKVLDVKVKKQCLVSLLSRLPTSI
ncbi:hypothetical protein F1880_008471, partial [Penicillium rolfsii]